MGEAGRDNGLAVIVDYSSGLTAERFPEIIVIGVDRAREERGDAPPRAAFVQAFTRALERRPAKVLCLTGPFGYSTAFTAASGARLDVGARIPDGPGLVQVNNTGRSFLGLGALALSLTLSSPGPEELDRWLDDAIPRTSTWVIVRTENLAALGKEHHLDPGTPLPDDEFVLLRFRLSAKVAGGYPDAEAALQTALEQATVQQDGIALVGSGLNLTAEAVRERPGFVVHAVTPPAYLTHAFGECAVLGIAPGDPRSGAAQQ